MKELTFDGFRQEQSYRYCGDAEYMTDFSSTEPRKYKQVDTGVRVYEGGTITVDTTTRRNPDLRHRLYKHFGLMFVNATTCPEFNFATPDGKKLTKASLGNQILMLDLDHKVAVGTEGPYCHKGIYYPHWNALPVGRNPVGVKVRDKPAEKEFMKKHTELFALCKTTYAMLATDRSFYANRYDLSWWIKGKVALDKMPADDKLQYMYTIGLGQTNGDLARTVAQHCRKAEKYAYLRLE